MKDLFDAVKEAYSQSVPSPAEDGWQRVRASMRRASVLRTLAWGGASIAACAAIAMLFVRVPDSGLNTVPASRVAEVTPSVPAVEVLPGESISSESVAVAPLTQLLTQQPVTGHKLVALADIKAEDAFPDSEEAETDTVEVRSVAADNVDASSSVQEVYEKQRPVQGPVPDRNVAGEEETQPENWWVGEPAPKNKRHLKVGVNASASPMSSASSNVLLLPHMEYLAVLKSNDFLYNFADSEIKSAYSNFASLPTSVSYSHDLPLGLGIALNFPLSDRFSIETGLSYTYLHSVEDNNGSLSDQRLHFAGIPVRAEYAMIKKKNFSLYAGAGASVEKCMKAAVGSRIYNEKRLQWAGEAFAGAEFKLWKSSSLYLQPTLSYWFTDTNLITYRTENPLVFSIDAGLRFHL